MYGQSLVYRRKIKDIWHDRQFVFPDLLESCGYKEVPNHCDAIHRSERQFISNAGLIENKFPRFHILKNDGEWYIHYDLKKDHFDKGEVVVNGYVLEREIRRLFNDFKRFFPKRFQKFNKGWEFII